MEDPKEAAARRAGAEAASAEGEPPRVHVVEAAEVPSTPASPASRTSRADNQGQRSDYFGPNPADDEIRNINKSATNQDAATTPAISEKPSLGRPDIDLEVGSGASTPAPAAYTDRYRKAPKKSYVQSLAPYSGRLSRDSWFRVMFRPFILFAYPAVLWSTVVYSLSVGWLIVLSESVSEIYRTETYNFTALQAGLVYISPFIGGVLGTVVAGKVSDVIVRWMARRNDGVYEPEFRLVMAFPVAISTTIGLMGFGWSAEERDAWIGMFSNSPQTPSSPQMRAYAYRSGSSHDLFRCHQFWLLAR